MRQINSLPSSLYYPQYNQANNGVVNANEDDNDDSKKIVIEVTPGDDNVDSGDRSQNTATISITTPNQERKLEVSREQVFTAVERQAKRNVIDNAVNGPGGSSNPVKSAVISNNLESENLEELAYLKVKTNQIETFTAATQNNSSSGSTDNSGNTTTAQDYKDSPAYQLNDAKSAYLKQQFVFSTLDRLDISEEI